VCGSHPCVATSSKHACAFALFKLYLQEVKKGKKNYVGGETPSTSIKEEETHWIKEWIKGKETK